MTLNDIVFNLTNMVRGGITSDDENISDDQIKLWVNYYRSVVIKRDLDKGKHLDPELIQDLGCVPVKLRDKSECCEITADCIVLRTVDKIPQPIDLNFKSGIIFVGDIDGGEQYMRADYSTVIWSQFERHTSKLPRYYQKDGFIYVINKDLSDTIRIRAIFEDPREAALFNTCDGDPCYDDDMDYPISSWMIPVINDLILKKELRIESVAPNDEENDARNKLRSPVRQP